MCFDLKIKLKFNSCVIRKARLGYNGTCHALCITQLLGFSIILCWLLCWYRFGIVLADILVELRWRGIGISEL